MAEAVVNNFNYAWVPDQLVNQRCWLAPEPGLLDLQRQPDHFQGKHHRDIIRFVGKKQSENCQVSELAEKGDPMKMSGRQDPQQDHLKWKHQPGSGTGFSIRDRTILVIRHCSLINLTCIATENIGCQI